MVGSLIQWYLNMAMADFLGDRDLPNPGISFQKIFSSQFSFKSLLDGNPAEIGRWFYLILLCTLSQYFPFHMVVIWPNFPPWQALKKWRMPSLFHIQISQIRSGRPPFPLMTPLMGRPCVIGFSPWVATIGDSQNQMWKSDEYIIKVCLMKGERAFEEWKRSERQEKVLIGIRELS